MLIRRTIIKAGGKAVSETLEIGMAEYIFLQISHVTAGISEI